MNTPKEDIAKAIAEMRSMASQILTEQSVGKHLFNFVADELERLQLRDEQWCEKWKRTVDDLSLCSQRQGALRDCLQQLLEEVKSDVVMKFDDGDILMTDFIARALNPAGTREEDSFHIEIPQIQGGGETKP